MFALVRGSSLSFLSLIVFFIALSLSGFAQTAGSLQGTVIDPSGAAVPGAKVVVRQQASEPFTQTVESDAVGKYKAESLKPGTYEVEVIARGFEVAKVKEAQVSAGATATVDVHLAIARAETRVEVIDTSAPSGSYQVERVDMGPLGVRSEIDTPYSLNTVPTNLMENQQARSFSDILKYLPSAQMEARGGIDVGRPQTRGFEGNVVSNSRMDGLNVVDTTTYPMEQFDRIEVMNGLAGSIYGPASPSGVFNFVQKRPTDATMFKVGLDYDSPTMPTVHGDFGGRLGKDGIFGYRINLLHTNGAAYVDGSHRRREMESGNFDIRITPNTVVEINGSSFGLHQRGLPGSFSYGSGTSTLLLGAPDPTQVGYGQNWGGMDLYTKTISSQIKHAFGSNWHITIGGLHQSAQRNMYNPTNTFTNNLGNYRTTVSKSYNEFVVDSNLAYLNGQFQTGPLTHEVVAGTNGFIWKNNAAPTSTTFTLGTASINAPATYSEPVWPILGSVYKSFTNWQQTLLFGDTISFAKRWLISLDGSMNWLAASNFNASGALTSKYNDSGFSPSASLTYKPATNMSTYFTYATSLYQGDTSPSTGVANPNTMLAPYRSWQYEVGYKVALSKLELSAAAFRMNRPFAFTDPTDLVFKVEGNQVNDGLDFMAKGKLTDHLNIFGGFTWLDPVLQDTGKAATSDKQVVGVPRIQVNFLAEYQVHHLRGVSLNLNIHHTGRRAGNDTNLTWADAYRTVDIGARYEHTFGWTEMTWRFGVTNLSDTHYWASIFPGSINGSSGSYSSFLGSPRTVSASVQFRFSKEASSVNTR